MRFNCGERLINFLILFDKKVFEMKNAAEAPIVAAKKTIIEPRYDPYKKPDNKDNQEAGSINKTIKMYKRIKAKTPRFVLKKKAKS
tara:strand:- start:86 stop:343 length:258 start_codon:yes stop_codon:yes gene_type:complete